MTKKLFEFLDNSETFNGITFNGCFTMPNEHFKKLLDHFIQTDVNLLDDYSIVITLGWEKDNENIYLDAQQISVSRDSISRIRELRVLPVNLIYDALKSLNTGRNNYKLSEERIRNQPRRDACKFTSDKKIRRKVFELHGENCLCCNSSENISLDHVIPVSKGGENSIDNMQPLCKSCNSTKGTSSTDYRHKL
jgi:5-methylcytosine-specific restriction endonuclease McrA